MERKTAIAVAGGISMVLVAGAFAMGANLGLLGSSGSGPAGKLRPTDLQIEEAPVAPQVVTVEVRDPASAGAPASSSEQPVQYVDVPGGDSAPASVESENEMESEDPEDHPEDREGVEDPEDPDDGSGHDD